MIGHDLGAAIEQLYVVFQKYSSPKKIVGCDDCVSVEDIARLNSRPLRELTWKELNKYSFKALTTFGDLDDFKRFLPRLLELLAKDADESQFDWQTILGKIRYAENNYRPLPQEPAFDGTERQAIEQFLMCWWVASLHEDPQGEWSNVADLLESIGNATGTVEAYLSRWEAETEINPAIHLARFVASHSDAILRKQPIKLIWWKDIPQCQQQLTTWLASQRPRALLEAAFQNVTDPGSQSELSAAVSTLEYLHTCAN